MAFGKTLPFVKVAIKKVIDYIGKKGSSKILAIQNMAFILVATVGNVGKEIEFYKFCTIQEASWYN